MFQEHGVPWGNISAHFLNKVVIGENLTLVHKSKRANFSHQKILALVKWFCNNISLNRSLCLLACLPWLLKHLFAELKEGQWEMDSLEFIITSPYYMKS